MKVALITGAGSGIGLATALKFLETGAAVVGVGRRPEALAELLRLAGPRSDRVATLSIDITADDAPARSVALATERFGRLDCLVNNAGMGQPRPIHDSSDELIDDSLDLMLRAPIRLTREALRAMGPGSSIVNVSSTYALVGGLRGGTYSAVKAGLLGLTSHVACQYGSSGVRCNAVAPGVIPTDMTRKRLDDPMFKRLNVDLTPALGWGTVEDVAAPIVFLCSEEARWINGQVLAIDGGWSSTRFMTEAALAAEHVPVEPVFTHSGKPRPLASEAD